MIPELRRKGVNTVAVTARISNETRAAVQAATFEGGRVVLRAKAPWLADLETELMAFPGARHDDQADAVVQALAYQGRTRRTTVRYTC